MRPARVVSRLLLPALLAGGLVACSGGSDALPAVTGGFGTKPKVDVKGYKPTGKLETKVLVEGKGPKVARGDLVVADYLGENVRSGKVFDNSYDRKTPLAISLKTGQGGVISGWVKALTGVPVGSRVVLVAPPKEGYGKQGNPQAGIKGSDSLAFVVDVIAAYPKDVPLPKSTPVPNLPADGPKVEGEQDPTLTVPAKTPPPTKPAVQILAEGSGPKVEKGRLLVVQYTAVSWNNQPLGSTWKTGPQGVPVGGTSASPFDQLVGVPVGSRVLLTLPAQQGANAAEQSVAAVIDVLGQHGPAKESKQ